MIPHNQALAMASKPGGGGLRPLPERVVIQHCGGMRRHDDLTSQSLNVGFPPRVVVGKCSGVGFCNSMAPCDDTISRAEATRRKKTVVCIEKRRMNVIGTASALQATRKDSPLARWLPFRPRRHDGRAAEPRRALASTLGLHWLLGDYRAVPVATRIDRVRPVAGAATSNASDDA